MSSIEHLLGLRVHGDVEIPDGEGGWIEVLPGGVHVGEEPPEEDERFLWLDPSEPPVLKWWNEDSQQWEPLISGGASMINLDGGRPDTVFGGIETIDGGLV